MEKIKQLDLPKDYRAIVISDIHGNLPLFERLLKKINYQAGQDYLFINGDMSEKGANSLGVVRKVMDLQTASERVIVTEGNCDGFARFVDGKFRGLIPYLKWRKHSICNEMLREIGMSIEEIKDADELKQVLNAHFQAEWTFDQQLYSAAETADFIVVHAGLENRNDWRATSEDFAVTVPAFHDLGHASGKLVIVGHYPVSNYTPLREVISNNPLIDWQKQIISTDGGNEVKGDGQLNALILTKEAGHLQVDSAYVHDFPVGLVSRNYLACQMLFAGNIHFPDFDVVQIKAGTDFSLCCHQATQEKILVKNEWLTSSEGSLKVKDDTTSFFLSVEKGAEVGVVCREAGNYSLVNYKGQVGWLPKELVLMT